MHIRQDSLTHPAVHALLAEHLQSMNALSPPESMHALDLRQLQAPNIAFFTAWEGDALLGCGAIKDLGQGHGEIKSMRTAGAHRGKGVGAAVLAHLIDHARAQGFQRLSLETGSQPEFAPAQRLYARFGFVYGEPFADYTLDPLSVFMTLPLVDA